MTTYNVTIDDNTMINILMNRVEYWVKDSDPSYSLYEGLITNLVYYGCFEGMKEFNPSLFVDNLYINDTVFYDTVDEAIADGFTKIAYRSDEDDGVIVWTC